jgi:hypothetical protein
MSDGVLHERYMPFSETQVESHFAPVAAAQDGRHTAYFRGSLAHQSDYLEALARGLSGNVRQGRQFEKDERFWIVTALMSIFHNSGGPTDRLDAIGALLERAQLQPPAKFGSWQSALAGELHLFFEANLPSPPKYRQWLRNHLDDRCLIPYVHEGARTRGERLEGATRADAVLLSTTTGACIIFEAKVLSDVSKDITFDVARNQLARLIDVMLEPPAPGRVQSPLASRDPALTSVVLLTPGLFHPRESTGLDKSRLYGWLMDAYRDPGSSLLQEHLPTVGLPSSQPYPADWDGPPGRTSMSPFRVPARGSSRAIERRQRTQG